VYKHLTFPQRYDLDPTAFYTEEGLFNEMEIEWILNNHKDVPYKIATLASDRHVEDVIRTSQIKWLPYDIYPQFEWIYNRLQTSIVSANLKLWNFDLISMPEPIQYTEYYGGSGHYDWHIDIGNQELSNRKVSITVQLSDPSEYEGGDLQFLGGPQTENASRGLGTVVIFPSYLLHRVTPVQSGTRKSLVLWVGGGSYR
tara:strand:- start:307 stop:903 length:597 start_codon:yes stop_codon:yes gene_type:complete